MVKIIQESVHMVKKSLYLILFISLLIWFIGIPSPVYRTVPFVRAQLLFVTGIISFLYLSLILLLSIRPKWLEKQFDGLDKMYVAHKWAGIWGLTFGLLHLSIKEFGKPVLSLFLEQGSKYVPTQTIFSPYKDIAKDFGEIALWVMLAAVVITLWQKFSYRIWRYTHKVMPVIYLLLVVHVIVMSPFSYWSQPTGIIIGACATICSVCAILALTGMIGKRHQYQGKIIQVNKYGKDIINITCQLQKSWQHKAGQFVFLLTDKWEGAHPFTLCASDKGKNEISVSIKSLGDYTRHLQNHLKVGDSVRVEGPYGCFQFDKHKDQKQIWIAGGIGITPFVAWLESMHQTQSDFNPDIKLYYSIRNESEAGFVPRLQELASQLSNVQLHIHYSDEMGLLTVDKIDIDPDHKQSIWFCGSNIFAHDLKMALAKQNFPKKQFHQEVFVIR